MSAQYKGQSKTTVVHYLENIAFDRIINEQFEERNKFRLKLTRGFTDGNEIFIREKAIIGVTTLIKHEFGHLFNLKHTLFPILMNPTWVLRWLPIPRIRLSTQQ
jgi:hypothetical protein